MFDYSQINKTQYTVRTDGSEGKQKIISANLTMFNAIEAAKQTGGNDVIITTQNGCMVAFYCSYTGEVKTPTNQAPEFKQQIRNLQGFRA